MSAANVPITPGAGADIETFQTGVGDYHRQVVIIGGTNSTYTPVDAYGLSVKGAIANVSAPAWAEGQQVPLSVDAAGALRTTSYFTSSSLVRARAVQTATANQMTFSIAPSYTPGNNSLDLFRNGVKMNVGVQYDYLELNSSQVVFNYALTLNDQVESIVLGIGVSGPYLQVTNSGASWTNVGYDSAATSAPVQVQNGLTVSALPTTTVYRNIDLGATGQVVKSSAGKIQGWSLRNDSGTPRYVKVYDKATAATQVDTPVLTLPVGASQSESAANVYTIPFASGISVRATTGVADNSTGAPNTNDVIVNIFYT